MTIQNTNGLIFSLTDAQFDVLHSSNARGVSDIKRHWEVFGYLSAARVEYLQKIVDRDKKQLEAAANVVPTGRGDFTGVIRSAKWTQGQWGDSLKATVDLGGGCAIWVSMPKNIKDWVADNIDRSLSADSFRGLVVGFTAEVKRKDGDPTFGFGKRASRAVVSPLMAVAQGAVKSGRLSHDVLDALAEFQMQATDNRGAVKAGKYTVDYEDGEVTVDVSAHPEARFNTIVTVTNEYTDDDDLVETELYCNMWNVKE